MRSALKRPVAPPPLDVSEPSAQSPEVSPPLRPSHPQMRPAQLPPQRQRAESASDLARSASCESEAAPKTPVDYEDTPFGPVPIYEPPEDHFTPVRRRNRSKPVIGPSRPVESPEASPFIQPPHSPPSDRSDRRGKVQVKSNDASQIGRAFLSPSSEGSTPLSASFGGFGGKASDIRNRILNERGGRA